MDIPDMRAPPLITIQYNVPAIIMEKYPSNQLRLFKLPKGAGDRI